MFLNLEKRINLHSLWLKIRQYQTDCADGLSQFTGVKERISDLEAEAENQLETNANVDSRIQTLEYNFLEMSGPLADASAFIASQSTINVDIEARLAALEAV